MGFFQTDARPIFHQTAGSLLAILIATIISAVAARSYHVTQQPLYKAIFVGVVVFLGLALAFLIIAIAANLIRKRGDQLPLVQSGTEKMAIEASPTYIDLQEKYVEVSAQLAGKKQQMKEEGRKLLAMTEQRNAVQSALSESRSTVARLEQEIRSLQAADDDFRWLHHLAERQAQALDAWVSAECQVGRFDLLRNKEPYIEFWLIVHNKSIFTVSLLDLRGSLEFANEPINGTVTWVDAPVQKLTPGDMNSWAIRLTINDTHDVARILNIRSGFTFDRLSVAICGEPWHIQSESIVHGSLSNDGVQYTKIEPIIQELQLKGYYDFSNPDLMQQCLGSVINIKLHFENPRQSRIDLVNFKLDTSPHIDRVTVAEKGEIYEGFNKLDVEARPAGKKLYNLAAQLPIAAEFKTPFEGWLQFIIRGVHPKYLQGATPSLIAVAESGEEHGRGCPALQYEP